MKRQSEVVRSDKGEAFPSGEPGFAYGDKAHRSGDPPSGGGSAVERRELHGQRQVFGRQPTFRLRHLGFDGERFGREVLHLGRGRAEQGAPVRHEEVEPNPAGQNRSRTLPCPFDESRCVQFDAFVGQSLSGRIGEFQAQGLLLSGRRAVALFHKRSEAKRFSRAEDAALGEDKRGESVRGGKAPRRVEGGAARSRRGVEERNPAHVPGIRFDENRRRGFLSRAAELGGEVRAPVGVGARFGKGGAVQGKKPRAGIRCRLAVRKSGGKDVG